MNLPDPLHDEQRLLLIRPHPVTLIGKTIRSGIVFGLLFALAYLLYRTRVLNPLLILASLILALLIPAVWLASAIAVWWGDYFLITDKRIIHELHNALTGRESQDQAVLNGIQGVSVSRTGIVGQAADLGSVIINRMGGQPPMVIGIIHDPLRVQKIILDHLQQVNNPKLDQRSGVSPTPAIPGRFPAYQPPPTVNPLNDIARTVVPHMRLVQGERVIYRKHWLVLLTQLWKPALGFILLIVAILAINRVAALKALPGSVIVVGSVVWIVLDTLWWYWEYVDWREDLYIVDNQWIIDIQRRPLWLRETRKQASLYQIQNVTSDIKSVWGQLFSVGDVIIRTAAEEGTMTFVNVHNPAAVAQDILDRLSRVHRRPDTVAFPPPPPIPLPGSKR